MFAAFEAFRAYFVNAETDFVCIDRVERIERGILSIVVDFAINIEASKARFWKRTTYISCTRSFTDSRSAAGSCASFSVVATLKL